MPFYPPFNMPFFYNNYMRHRNSFNAINTSENYYKQKASENYNKQEKKSPENSENSENRDSPNNRENSKTSEAFFEIFGLKLYFDDILIMCILFFLYTEKVHDDELFICLILLLLT